MDRIIDFSNCKRAHATFGGSDRKFGVVYDGETYMLKFSEHHAKKHDVSTSYVNNAISEYISSHIAQSVGLPAHETVLGTYNEEIVVGCKDFRSSPSVSNVEFAEYVRAKYESSEVGRLVRLDQIYSTLTDPANDIPPELQKATIERYWDTFVIDAFVGNFDRHIGNWGYLSENNKLRLAPIYDFGSTLFPQLSDVGAQEYLGSEFEMLKRCLVFPSPALVITEKKVGKVGYYDMLASGYDLNCTEAVLRIAPKIDMKKVDAIIENTPFITDIRKKFYKAILQLRQETILTRAYVRCFYHDYDLDALSRLNNGKQFSEEDLNSFIRDRKQAAIQFQEIEDQLAYSLTKDYAVKTTIDHSIPPVNRDALLLHQQTMMEKYGFNSEQVSKRIRCTIENKNKKPELSNR